MSSSLKPLYYFAYGSNMNPARVAERKLPIEGEPLAGELANFKLSFNKISRYREGAASANIEACDQAVVKGVLYRLTASDVIESMDRFENSPEDYAREVVFVQLTGIAADDRVGSLVSAWTYIAKPHAIDNSLHPTREYMGHLLASPFMCDTERARLRLIKCFDD
ncbi:MAG: gamma-glutamylcyclotransferase [Gammaproteobacteria bacterium]|nr:gamma-glutamylcyclotransferase [Gammaproteobacteria bacterium]